MSDTTSDDAAPRMSWAAPFVAAATLVAYLPALGAGYIWDDDKYVTQNPTLTSASGLWEIWANGFATPQYYPLVHTSYWIEHRLWGFAPFGYHLDNVLLHLLGALLFWRLLLRLGIRGAGFAAALFALHPVHVESVAWVTERKNVLSGVFYFATALAYFRATDAAAPALVPVARRWYYAALTLFVCALLSKSVTVTLPVALAIVVLWKRRRASRGELLPLVPFLVVGVLMASLTAWLEKHHVGAAGQDWHLGVLDRAVIAARALWFYAGKLLWPHPLIFVYPRWDVTWSRGINLAWPLSVLAVGAVLLAARRRIGFGPLATLAVYAVSLSPALGFVDFYPMRFSFVADHFQYHASAALLAGLGSLGALAVTGRERGRGASASGWRLVAIAVLAGAGLATWQQAHAYRDEATIWRDTLAKNPDAWLAHLNLGRLEAQAGSLAAADRHLSEAARLKPDEPRVHVNLGGLRILQDRLDEAIDELRTAARLDVGLAEAHFNLGIAYQRRGDLEAAIHSFQNTLEVDPSYVGAAVRLRELLGRGAAPPQANVPAPAGTP
ncbi:MAG: tetratricopeptide repeat protein [bacterium]